MMFNKIDFPSSLNLLPKKRKSHYQNLYTYSTSADFFSMELQAN